MKTVILACRSLEKEVRLAMSRSGVQLPLTVLNDNNHDIPANLRKNLQQLLDGLEPCGRVLLAFGICGGAMAGLRTHGFELILPRVDDCLSLLMGSMERRQAVLQGGFGIFLTDSWLRNDRSMAAELDRIERRYPPQRASQVIQAMYGKFDSLNVIDTGAYPLESILPQTRALARKLNLEHRIQQGTTAYLEQLLTGPWPPERFIRVPPDSMITDAQVLLTSNRP